MNTASKVAAATITQSILVPVPDVTLPNGITVPSFRVGQYLCSKAENGLAVVTASGAPWVNINYHDAKSACQAAGFKLISELQMLAIAHNIANQGKNWTDGSVGRGMLVQGLRKKSVESAQIGDYVPPDPDERRWFELSNGVRIYDIAGNASSWVVDDVQGNEHGLVAKKFTVDSPSITTARYRDRGTGLRPTAVDDWSGLALIRGGHWRSGGNAGAFHLSRGWPEGEYDRVGFRWAD